MASSSFTAGLINLQFHTIIPKPLNPLTNRILISITDVPSSVPGTIFWCPFLVPGTQKRSKQAEARRNLVPGTLISGARHPNLASWNARIVFWGRIQISKTDSSSRLKKDTDWYQALDSWTPSWPMAGVQGNSITGRESYRSRAAE